MRRALIALSLALLGGLTEAEAPAPQTVANCATDMECENGPNPSDPWNEHEEE